MINDNLSQMLKLLKMMNLIIILKKKNDDERHLTYSCSKQDLSSGGGIQTQLIWREQFFAEAINVL